MTDVWTAKRTWRRMLRGMNSHVLREDCRALDAALCQRLWEQNAARGGALLLGYAPLPDEPDITDFLRRWLANAGELALPAWVGESGLALRRVRNLERDIRPGRAEIAEPLDDLPLIAPEEVDAALIPGRAFSENCQRLGRGAGCYDGLLRGRKMCRIGVCYDFQVFPRIPAGTDDEEMHMIVTPARLIRNQRKAAQ